jgi:archaellum biogenesis ATPase FlaH
MAFDKVVALIGDRGTGKTLFSTSLAKFYSEQGVTVFSNITYRGFAYTPLKFADIKNFPEWLRDGVIILDEMHVGADSYKFLSKDVQGITTFITQIRKLNLSFIYITQNFSTIVKRLRIQTNHSYQFRKIEDGIAQIDIFDNMNFYMKLNTIIFNGRSFYGNYDTNQLITNE